MVCLSQTDYTSGTVSFTSNYQFTGPDTPADEDVVKDSCTLQDSQWSDHVFTTDDLLFRVGDVVDDEVSAKVFFQDGVSLDGWNDLTPATIDSLLQK